MPKTWLSSVLILAASAAIPLLAQQAPPGVPAERGIYYRSSDSEWIPLPRTILLPLNEGDARSIFGLGAQRTSSQLSGAHALIRTGTSPRPTFYVRRFSPFTGLYLVRSQVRDNYRAVTQLVSRHPFDSPRFRKGDLIDTEVRLLTGDLVSLQPRADLKPGEYVIIAPADADFRWIDFGYSFGVPANTASVP